MFTVEHDTDIDFIAERAEPELIPFNTGWLSPNPVTNENESEMRKKMLIPPSLWRRIVIRTPSERMASEKHLKPN